MTGYQSKKAAAQDKLNDDDDTQVYGDALTIAYQSGYHDGKKAAQRPWVEPTEGEWFNWWRASPVADATEAEIDFADFLIIAQAVTDKLKDDNK